jgi:hypothetical protein
MTHTVVDADVIDIETIGEALKTSPFGRCVYEAGNDVMDHQTVSIEYDTGATANIVMSACKSPETCHAQADLLILPLVSKAECQRQTRIAGTKGELIGDMESFVSYFSLEYAL